MHNRDELLKDLRSNLIEIHIRNTEGEIVSLRCTLKLGALPESYKQSLEEQTMEKDFHIKNQELIAAWDVGSGAWRSFNINSVVYTSVLDVY